MRKLEDEPIAEEQRSRRGEEEEQERGGAGGAGEGSHKNGSQCENI